MANTKIQMRKPAPLCKKEVDSMLRVNQAGEFGAIRIYTGQRAILGESSIKEELSHMQAQEEAHKKLFDDLLVHYQVRPTVLSPLWHIGGYAMGFFCALLGKKGAMACTVAVEEVIDAHYEKQLERLPNIPKYKHLRHIIAKCQAEEQEHRDIGLDYQAEDLRGYEFFTKVIKRISKTAIWLSKRY